MDAMIDAPPNFDFSCIGNAAPGSAAANITVSGTVTEIDVNGITPSFKAFANAHVDVCTGNCVATNNLGSGSSDGSGAFSIGPFATGGTPVDGYLKITPPLTGSGSNDTAGLEYPADPIVANLAGVPTFTATPNAKIVLANLCGQDWSSQGALAIAVTDCANMPITDTTNTTLVVQQGGSAVAGTAVINLGMLSSMAAGTYLICKVPPNASTDVNATYMATTGLKTFRLHTVSIVAGDITATQVRPGY